MALRRTCSLIHFEANLLQGKTPLKGQDFLRAGAARLEQSCSTSSYSLQVGNRDGDMRRILLRSIANERPFLLCT